jgi:hypothetical protein
MEDAALEEDVVAADTSDFSGALGVPLRLPEDADNAGERPLPIGEANFLGLQS